MVAALRGRVPKPGDRTWGLARRIPPDRAPPLALSRSLRYLFDAPRW